MESIKTTKERVGLILKVFKRDEITQEDTIKYLRSAFEDSIFINPFSFWIGATVGFICYLIAFSL